MSHTEGPWILEITDDTIWVGTGKNNNTKVDDIVIGLDIEGVTKEYKERQLANAKLIAAAPDLLEVLQKIVENVERNVYTTDLSEDDFTYRKAKAAIKKATT